jgi:DNA-binding Lrp family transcriptional regulator
MAATNGDPGKKVVSAVMGGFTPLFECVVQDVGIVGAAVFGRIWRYCQGRLGVCVASIGTIASELNMSERTVIRWQKTLCEAGYLKDLTPDLRNKPHTYQDTGKVTLMVSVQAKVNDQAGMTESHPASGHCDRKSPQTPPAMTESHPQTDLKSVEERSKREDNKREKDAAPVEEIPFPALAIFKEEMGNGLPSKSWCDKVVEAVGTVSDDLDRWRECCYAWAGQGYNRKAVAGPLEWFRDGIPERARSGIEAGRGSEASTPPQPTVVRFAAPTYLGVTA